MWKSPWGWSEGAWICGGLMVSGMMLQLTAGSVDWQQMAMPVNVIVLSVYIISLLVLYALRRRIYFVRWAMSRHAAVSSLISVVLITLVMGLIRQAPDSMLADVHHPLDLIGLNRMLSFWPFVLLYIWMTTILGLVSIRQIHEFRLRNLPVVLNHLGLFIALTCATLGNADMRRMKMNTTVGTAEWRATGTDGTLHELPLAIELHDFTLDEYPPKLMLISNATGDMLTAEMEELRIDTLEVIDMAARVGDADSLRYIEWHSIGATTTMRIRAVKPDGTAVEGWVSCGSFIFPYQALRIDSMSSIVMPVREPRRFASDVTIYTESGKRIHTVIEVNKPASVEGWKIYQLGYDETKGRWSDASVFELVADPWLPFVYAGIAMMMLGAVCMFVAGSRIGKDNY